MANNLYRKQKRQYSTDNGVTWKDVTPPVYQVGALIEENSDCSTEAGSIQYRWFSYDISDNYTCDTTSHTKYNLEVLQYSYDGMIWQNTTETRRGSQMESNSCDCGYTEYRWNLIPDRYVCGTEDFSKYGVEVYQVGCGDNWQNVEPYEERVTDLPIECFSLDCGAESNQLAFTWDKSILTSAQINYNGTDYTFYNPDGVVSTDMHTIGICSLTDTSNMFNRSGYKNPYLTITKLPDTYYVTTMSGMFVGCSGLTELNVSDLRTDNVTDMSGMFVGCSGLNELDVTNFNTSNVSNMENMFGNCFNLTSLDLSNFNTSNVTNMSYMFSSCSGLNELDLSNWKTDSLINMDSMFYGCSGLTSLDLSNFDTSNVTDVTSLFYGCSGLKYINLSGWDLSDIDLSYNYNIFKDCNNLEYVIINDVNCDTYEFIRRELNQCDLTYKIITNIFDCDNNTLVMDSYSSNQITVRINNKNYYLERGSYAYDSLTTERFTNARGFVSGSSIIERIDEMFDTSNVTDMSDMFSSCADLVYINTRNMDTSNVTTMSRMFYNCYDLTKLNLSDFNTSNVVDVSNMFYGCSMLSELNVSNWDISNVTNYNSMFKYCSRLSKLIINNNYDKWCEILTQSDIDCNIIMICENSYNNTLSNYKLNYEHNAVVEFNEVVTPVITATKNTTIVFDDCSSVELPETETMVKCNIEYIPNGNNFTDEDRIVTCYVDYKDIISDSFTFTQKHFEGDIISYQYVESSDFGVDSRLSSIYINGDLYHNTLDELKLIDGNNNIYQWDIIPSNIGIENINKIKFHWDITSLLSMKIDSLNDMSNMFEACYSLKNVNFNGVNTSNVTNMSYMFYNCDNLTSLDVSNFDTSNVTTMGSMFSNCIKLPSLDLSNFNTSNVTNMSYMFSYCNSLTELNLSGWDLSNIYSNSDTDAMFTGCTNLTTIYCYGCNQTTIDKLNNLKPTNCTLVY